MNHKRWKSKPFASKPFDKAIARHKAARSLAKASQALAEQVRKKGSVMGDAVAEYQRTHNIVPADRPKAKGRKLRSRSGTVKVYTAAEIAAYTASKGS